MGIWEIIIIMVVCTICVGALSKIVSSSILDEIDKYKTRRNAQNAKVFSTIFDQMADSFGKMLESVKAKDEEQRKEAEKAEKEFHEEMKKWNSKKED